MDLPSSTSVDLVPLRQMVEDTFGAPVRLGAMTCRTLQSGSGRSTGGILRWSGRAAVGGKVRRWSIILKITRDWQVPRSSDPDSPEYWKREYLFYRSNLASSLPPATLSAPRCLAAEDRGTEAWLWLEDLGVRPKI